MSASQDGERRFVRGARYAGLWVGGGLATLGCVGTYLDRTIKDDLRMKEYAHRLEAGEHLLLKGLVDYVGNAPWGFLCLGLMMMSDVILEGMGRKVKGRGVKKLRSLAPFVLLTLLAIYNTSLQISHAC